MLGAFPMITFSAIVVSSSVFMLAQGFYALWHARSRTGKNMRGQDLRYELLDNGDVCEDYEVLCGEVVTHATALPALMDTCRMASLIEAFDKAYLANIGLENGLVRYRLPLDAGKALWRTLCKFTMYNVLGAQYSINVQVAGLGLARAASPTHAIDLMTLGTVLLGSLMQCYFLVTTYKRVKELVAMVQSIDIALELQRGIQRRGVDSQRASAYAEAFAVGDWADDVVWATVQGMPVVTDHGASRDLGLAPSKGLVQGRAYQLAAPRLLCYFVCFMLATVMLLIRAAFQLFMVTIWCETGLHNMGVGCVSLPASLVNVSNITMI